VPSGLGRARVLPLSRGGSARGSSQSYDRGELSVWYAERPSGLEQGYNLLHRPAGNGAEVAIAMASSGDLLPVQTGPTTVALRAAGGRPGLDYSGLRVTDAMGRVLPARLAVSGTQLRIVFDDQGARYPVRIDPFIQFAGLIPPANASAFGTAVATSSNGDTVLVGDSSGGTGGAGQATIYTYTAGSWSTGVTLTVPAGSSGYASTVALSGDGLAALVGDPSGVPNGTATAYIDTGGTWSAGTQLTAPASAFEFGTSVALAGTVATGMTVTALVGDPGGGLGTGAATVFTYSGGTWSAGTNLDMSNAGGAGVVNPQLFGTSVALSPNGTYGLVGDPNGGPGSVGAVYLYSSAGSWGGTATRFAHLPTKSKNFGAAVAIANSGQTAIVGDPTGGVGTGQATIMIPGLTGWTPQAELGAPTGSQAFGTSVALDQNGVTAVVGSPPSPTNTGPYTGAASTYSYNGTAWSAGAPLVPPFGIGTFGTSVALSADGSTAAVGDPTGGNLFTGAVTIYSSHGSAWNFGTAATVPAGAQDFGNSVAVSSDASTVLEGDNGGGAGGDGAASVFSYNGQTLSAGDALTQPSGAQDLGASVALDGNGTEALVGDPDSIANNPSGGFGAATVYTFANGSWSSGTPLSVPADGFYFGNSVALSANGLTALVGDPGAGGAPGTGEATVYTFANGAWSAGTPLTAPPGVVIFGTTVALSADGATALVGDPRASGTGAVTLYTFANGTWSAGTPLPVPAQAKAFGTALALSAPGSTALVGDPTGGASGKGAATVYAQNGPTWTAEASLPPLSAAASFGSSVALSVGGTEALVGDPGSALIGSATLYDFSGSSWSSGTALTPPATTATIFGTSVGLSGNGLTAAVGDPGGGVLGTGAVTVYSFDTTLTSTTTTVGANPSSSLSGTSVNYSATVAAVGGGGPPTGTVSFTWGPLTLCTATLAAGAGNCNATTTPVGTGQVFATYTPDVASANTYTSSIGSTPVTVSYPSSTTIGSVPAGGSYGTSITYSAHVTSVDGTPTGTVSFNAGGTALCTTPALVSGIATCSSPNAPVGAPTVVTGTYSGDTYFASSHGNTNVTVTIVGSTTTVSAVPSSTPYGANVSYSAVVSPASGTGTVAGTVSFSANGTFLCTAIVTSGSAGCSASNAPQGSDTVIGTYSGNSNLLSSMGTASLTVGKGSSTTSVLATPSSATPGSSVTFSASVAPQSGTGSPTGTVSFNANGTFLCTGTLASGSASCSASDAPTGTDTVTGTYSGDSNFLGSSGTATLTVGNPPAPAAAPGYDLVGNDGGVFVFPVGKSSGFFGSLPGLGVHVSNIVGIVPTVNEQGYFLVGFDGGVFAFGNAPFENSLPGIHVHVNNIVGIVPTSNDAGYFLAGSDGGVFAFGNAPFENSLPGLGVHVNNIVGIVPTADDLGYWVVSSTGAVYALGDAPFVGSLGGKSPTPIVGIAATHDSGGYWLVGKNGAVFPFGNAQSFGSLPALGVSVSNIVAIVPTPDGQGYWLIGSDGGIFAFGDAAEIGSLPGIGVHVSNIVGAVPTA